MQDTFATAQSSLSIPTCGLPALIWSQSFVRGTCHNGYTIRRTYYQFFFSLHISSLTCLHADVWMMLFLSIGWNLCVVHLLHLLLCACVMHTQDRGGDRRRIVLVSDATRAELERFGHLVVSTANCCRIHVTLRFVFCVPTQMVLVKGSFWLGRLDSWIVQSNGTVQAKFQRSKAAKAAVAGGKAQWLWSYSATELVLEVAWGVFFSSC